MEPERWRRLNNVFHAALQREASARETFVIEACGEDHALRTEIGRLLSAHEQAGDAVGTAALGSLVASAAADAVTLPAGGRIGAYRVLAELGRGGMGAVYLAERDDDQYRMRVAIKVIKLGMDSDQVLRQFSQERQILASLEHPGVARLLDGGTTTQGRPYFVMEYVDGVPIDRYCRERALDVEQRLELFRRVCNAVAYAHQRLVVHRDLKPSNIIVGAEGHPKLLDFGVAKIMAEDRADTRATVDALGLMTPEYASPEQRQGLPATTLSDVYSLGVVLHELLTGQRPDRAHTTGSSALPEDDGPARRPSETVADSSSGMRQRLRGDLDTIVLKALDAEPARRYQSVEQLADEVRRHLEHRPILARADSLSYRATKFVRRRKAAVLAAALVGVSLVAGVSATVWQARRAMAQERAAKAQQARAERRFNDVRTLAHTLLFDYHDAIENLPGATPVRARLVQDALTYLDSLSEETAGDPGLERELASAYERVAEVQGGNNAANLGDSAGAIASYRKAVALYEGLAASHPHDTPTRQSLASVQRRLGVMLVQTGDLSGALKSTQGALAVLSQLASEHPADVNLRHDKGRAQISASGILEDIGDQDGALGGFTAALETFEALARDAPGNKLIRRNLSVVHYRIATALITAGKPAEATAANARAIAVQEQLAAESPASADYQRLVAISYYNQGNAYAALHRYQEGAESFHRSLDILERLSAVDTSNETYRTDLAFGWLRLAQLELSSAHAAKSVPGFRRSQTLRRADRAADGDNLWKRAVLIEAGSGLSEALARAGERAAALADAADTLALMEGSTVDPANASIRSVFAESYGHLGEAHAVIAADRSIPAGERDSQRRRACELFQQSLEVWKDLVARSIVSGIDRERPAAAERRLASCTAVN